MFLLCAAAIASSLVGDFDMYVSTAVHDYAVPGAAVVVVEDGKVVLCKGYGFRDIASKAPVDENTIFQLASVSKAFTGTLAGALVDEGKLDLDRPIFNYLPQFAHYDPYVARHMTTRDLLAMRTGWPAFSGDLLGQLGYSRAEVLRRLRYFKPAYSLRDVATYSNPGLFVAGEVEAAVAGATWDDLMASRIFGPLGMGRSGTKHEALADANSSKNYAIVDGKVVAVPSMNHNVLGAAGSVCSTAADMGNWLTMLADGGKYQGKQVLKPETVASIFDRSMVGAHTMAELPPISGDTGFYYGLGVGSYDYAGTRIIEKGGAIAGVRTVVVVVPSKRAAIAVMANMNLTALPEAIRAEWLTRLLKQSDGEANAKEIAKRNEGFKKMFTMPAPPKNPRPAPFSTGALVGVYENELYGRFEVARSGDGLVVFAGPSRYRGTLRHWDGGLYSLKWPSVTDLGSDTTFTIGEDGKAVRLTNEVFGEFVRVKG